MRTNRSTQRPKNAGTKKTGTSPTRPSRSEPREGSAMWAAIEVLRGQREPMTATEIYTEIKERKLAPGLKGKTPEQTIAANLAVAAKHGKHVERAAPGKYQLRKEA